MIGFSASFAKTINILLKELKNESKTYQYIFSTIISHIEENKYYFSFPYNEFVEICKVLKYNGFDIDIISQEDDEVTFIVKW